MPPGGLHRENWKMDMDKPAPYHIVTRIEWITEALEHGINCTDIAAKFGISTKTAQRDINFLRRKMIIEYDATNRILIRKEFL